MKKFTIFLALCLLLTGCSAPAAPTQAPISATQPPSEAPTQNVTVPPTTEIPTTIPPVSIGIYIPNDNADAWNITTVDMAEPSPELIVACLIDNGVLNREIALNTFELVDNQIRLDFNEAFLDQLRTYGTAGERMMIGSVVNTFLSAYNAETVSITVDGEIMESGHVIYDFPLSFQE